MKLKEFLADYGIVLALIVLFGVLALTTDRFLTGVNLENVIRQNTIVSIVAVGMTLVILTGGIDLSVGSVVSLAGVATAYGLSRGHPVVIAVLYGAGVGACTGLLNGLFVTRLKIPPFLASLALMQIALGIARRTTDARTVPIPRDANFDALMQGITPAIIVIVVFSLVAFVLARTPRGRHVYAVGGNPEAARLAGIRVKSTLLGVYVTCGLFAGLAGVLMAARLNSGDPDSGALMELDAIAGVVVGGTSLFGGRGSVWGTLAGVFFIGILDNGLSLNGVDSDTQRIVIGVVLVAAMTLDLVRRRGGRS